MAFLARLRRRERIPEMMDDPQLDAAEHRRALDGLARINRWSGSVGVLWSEVRRLARGLGRPLRLLDVATGSGDVPAGLLARAKRAGLSLEVSGCDISPIALEAAAAACPAGHFFIHDVIREPLPPGFDVVSCSLFLHHLSAEDAITVLGRMKAATNRLVLVNDLARSRLNYLSVEVACRLLSRSPVVHFDGPASVRSAFTPAEALELAESAGLSGASVRRRIPCRFLLAWAKQ